MILNWYKQISNSGKFGRRLSPGEYKRVVSWSKVSPGAAIKVEEDEWSPECLERRAPSASDHGFTSRGDEARKRTKNDEELNSLGEGSSPEVVENPKKDESKNGVVEKMREDVVENRKEIKKEEKSKEEKAYEGEVEKIVENESSAKKDKKPLVKDPKFQVPSPYARMPYPRMKRVKNQDLEVCGVVSECFKVEVLEEVEKDGKEEEWDHEIEIFLQNLDNPLEEEKEPKAIKKPPELKELPPKWKYVFLGGDSRKPMIISDLLTPLEENDLLKEAEKVNDDLGWVLDGVVPIYCLHKVAKKEPNPVVNPQKSSTSTLKASMNQGSKKSPSRSSKKERTNLKAKWEGLKSDSGSVKSLLFDINIAPLNEENKRSRRRAPSASDHGFTSRGDEARKRTKNDEELNSLGGRI
ncbi:unnamed protein product [Trifolium pratense]|uniref:Uncharacterized protein n=1 Tax=Trifolium pratense TaxID=57577 RepID=A0ACB0LE70_TRIPR|nr:unnamed protein product [Trifolium pratense]